MLSYLDSESKKILRRTCQELKRCVDERVKQISWEPSESVSLSKTKLGEVLLSDGTRWSNTREVKISLHFDAAFSSLARIPADHLKGAFPRLQHFIVALGSGVSCLQTFQRPSGPLLSSNYAARQPSNIGNLMCSLITHLDLIQSGVRSLNSFAQCKTLRHLQVGGVCEMWNGFIACHAPVTNLSPLTSCNFLKHLSLHGCHKVHSLEPLPQAVQLQYLDISGTSVSCLRPLERCIRLQHLACNGCLALRIMISVPVAHLEHLDISSTVHRLYSLRCISTAVRLPQAGKYRL
ncbi:hypothetical protein CEUSTIGMA_g3920.t1 [Chlamydomonas eustigma]|uniref:Uncharacterized protein n=1 Tax=Chlamydomonas eustigma TaxID=1157962 RepID=A0A250X099_9CHLO|nr:hypothetical protein CEUSTIGMA_g3920.t1 [Chlamydomonas eustigma]|eukprot:GAX76475.1 hypothetical protein CEUSTIGMA_g3920.t1 [Chlamydomonas eustigma]